MRSDNVFDAFGCTCLSERKPIESRREQTIAFIDRSAKKNTLRVRYKKSSIGDPLFLSTISNYFLCLIRIFFVFLLVYKDTRSKTRRIIIHSRVHVSGLTHNVYFRFSNADVFVFIFSYFAEGSVNFLSQLYYFQLNYRLSVQGLNINLRLKHDFSQDTYLV